MADRKPWRLFDLALSDVEEHPPDLAVMSFGATEPHGKHLPYGTDVIEVEAIADRACEIAYGEGAKVVTLPAIPFGCQTNQMRFPLAMNLYPSTLNQIISDLTEVLERCGVKKAVLLNGHGGNDFYPHLRELYGRRKIFLVQVNWFDMVGELQQELFPAGGEHANDLESSLVLHLRPELVEMSDAGPQPMAVPRIPDINSSWAKTPRAWHLFTEDSGAGDPRQATAEKGQRFFAAVCRALAKFLADLAKAEVGERFPY